MIPPGEALDGAIRLYGRTFFHAPVSLRKKKSQDFLRPTSSFFSTGSLPRRLASQKRANRVYYIRTEAPRGVRARHARTEDSSSISGFSS
jgi:hypothetical protein